MGWIAGAQTLPESNKPQPVKLEQKKENLQIKSSIPVIGIAVKNDSIKKTKLIDGPVTANAKGNNILNRKNNTMTLIDEAVIIYGDYKIEAGKIILENDTGNIFAAGIPDSLKVYSQKPVFTQGATIIKPDSILANRFSKKLITYNASTTQAEFNVNSEITKRVNDSTLFLQNVRFTTSKDPDDPSYYFLARRAKLNPGNKLITGRVVMHIVNIPTPLQLPFSFFPITTDRKSGLILPSPGNTANQGFSLQNGGYYFALSDYVDLTLLGDYFTNGSFGLRAESDYRVRYKFAGSVRVAFENQIQSERGFSDFNERTNYNINWQHSQDAKSSNSSRFSASVNLGSSQYFRQSFNQINQAATLNNTLNSSVSYSKTFQGDPQVAVTASALHSQNTNVSENLTNITLSLPTVQASVSRFFPFAPKEGIKKGIVHNLNLQYNLRSENNYATTEEEFLTAEMFKNGNNGLQHTIPLSTNFKLGPYFNVGASANYSENWVFKTFNQVARRNEAGTLVVQRDTVNGFDAYRTYGFGANIGTSVFGNWQSSNPKAKVQAIRHVIRPSASYSVNPSFEQYYDRILDEQGLDVLPEQRLFSRFEGTLFGAPGRVSSSSVSFNIQNTLEAKVRERDSTKTELKKISLLKSLNLSSAYNISGDSLRISPLQMSGVIPITKTVDFNFDANFDPYALDNDNNRIDTFNINNGGSLFRLTRAGGRINFRISNEDFKKKDLKDDKLEGDDQLTNPNIRNGGREDDLFGINRDIGDGRNFEEEPVKQNVDVSKDRYRIKIPWSLNIAHTITYANDRRQSSVGNHSLMFSGDVQISPRWTVGGNSGYDFVGQGISYTNIRFERDLEDFRLSFNWTPIGFQESWFFFIGIKSGALSDLKYEQRRQPDAFF